MDLWGPYPIRSRQGHRYMLVLVDDHSRYSTVFFLHTKDQVPAVVINWAEQCRNHFKRPIGRLHSDGGDCALPHCSRLHPSLPLELCFHSCRPPPQSPLPPSASLLLPPQNSGPRPSLTPQAFVFGAARRSSSFHRPTAPALLASSLLALWSVSTLGTIVIPLATYSSTLPPIASSAALTSSSTSPLPTTPPLLLTPSLLPLAPSLGPDTVLPPLLPPAPLLPPVAAPLPPSSSADVYNPAAPASPAHSTAPPPPSPSSSHSPPFQQPDQQQQGQQQQQQQQPDQHQQGQQQHQQQPRQQQQQPEQHQQRQQGQQQQQQRQPGQQQQQQPEQQQQQPEQQQQQQPGQPQQQQPGQQQQQQQTQQQHSPQQPQQQGQQLQQHQQQQRRRATSRSSPFLLPYIHTRSVDKILGAPPPASIQLLEDSHEEFLNIREHTPFLASLYLDFLGFPVLGATTTPTIFTPSTFQEAITCPDADKWIAAIFLECGEFIRNDSFVDVPLPAGANLVDGKWVFRVKQLQGEEPVYKARYCAKGFTQTWAEDYWFTYAPTAKPPTLRAAMDIGARDDMEIDSIDVSNAFLQGDLHERIFLRRPPGFHAAFPENTVWQLRRPVYGLKRAPREWHAKLAATLGSLGFSASHSDASLFIRSSPRRFFILVYVDDMILLSDTKADMEQVKLSLQQRLKCKDLGALTHYLGMTITRNRPARTITLSQSHYIGQVLEKFDMAQAKPVSTPLPFGHQLAPPHLPHLLPPPLCRARWVLDVRNDVHPPRPRLPHQRARSLCRHWSSL
ncbi:unnamed protein product [Closterium sp. Naga37s-1]|nr:unnamed protein product [Closterium sp. Naga37s-1]